MLSKIECFTLISKYYFLYSFLCIQIIYNVKLIYLFHVKMFRGNKDVRQNFSFVRRPCVRAGFQYVLNTNSSEGNLQNFTPDF